MILIIKQGKEENYKFEKTCPICGCVFTYELSDLKKEWNYGLVYTTLPPQYGYKRYVECPCCHERIFHDSGVDINDDFVPPINYTNIGDVIDGPSEEEIKNRQFYVDYGNPGGVWNTGFGGEWDCEHCINKPDPNNQIAGDTPCNWCPKMQPKCTCK